MRGANSHEPVLALVSGDNRADEARIEEAIGEPIERPDAAYVREVTGYAIGGIPPVGHPRHIIDRLRRGPAPLRDRVGRGRPSARGLPDRAREARGGGGGARDEARGVSRSVG